MQIKMIQEEQLHIIAIEGDLDIATSDALKLEVDRMLEQNPKGVIFDFQQLEFVDSTGVGTLLDYFHQLMELNISFYLVQLNEGIYEVFEILGLPVIIGDDRIVKSVEEARRMLCH